MITVKRDNLGQWWLSAATSDKLTVIHLGNKPTISAGILRSIKEA